MLALLFFAMNAQTQYLQCLVQHAGLDSGMGSVICARLRMHSMDKSSEGFATVATMTSKARTRMFLVFSVVAEVPWSGRCVHMPRGCASDE